MATRNINQNWNNQIGGNLFGFAGDNQGITTPNLVPENKQQYFSGTNPGAYGSGDWRSNMNQLYNWGDSGARYNYDRPYNMRDVAGEVGEYSQRPGEGNNEMMNQAQKKGWSLPNFGITGIMRGIADKFQRPEQMNEAYESITDTIDPATGRGTYKGNEYRIEGNKIYSELYPEGKNFDSWRGSESIEEMENEGYGSIGWARDRLLKGKKISTRLRNILERRGLDDVRPSGEGAQFEGGDVPAAATPVTTGGGGTFNPAMDEKGRRDTRDSWHGATQARGVAKKQVAGPGFGRGAYWADGGRVGYQGGELVEQQTDLIEGPQGGEEFQETVVEGQEQPSREQLEALSMHIFQLPLDDLDEQQLVVVYQAAMQEQPMEESVQEEDVQFAANGGLAGLL